MDQPNLDNVNGSRMIEGHTASCLAEFYYQMAVVWVIRCSSMDLCAVKRAAVAVVVSAAVVAVAAAAAAAVVVAVVMFLAAYL